MKKTETHMTTTPKKQTKKNWMFIKHTLSTVLGGEKLPVTPAPNKPQTAMCRNEDENENEKVY
jgi:hypothetical protein